MILKMTVDGPSKNSKKFTNSSIKMPKGRATLIQTYLIETAEVEKSFLVLKNEFEAKSKEYSSQAKIYENLNFWVILVPAVLLEIFKATLPVILRYYERDSESIPEKIIAVSSFLAAVTLAIASASSKLSWEKKAEQLLHCAQVYSIGRRGVIDHNFDEWPTPDNFHG